MESRAESWQMMPRPLEACKGVQLPFAISTREPSVRRSFASVVLLALLAACTADLTNNNGGGGGGGTPPLNRYTELSSSLEDAAESEVAMLTIGVPGLPLSFPTIANCPGVSSIADADADGVPDDVTFTYTNPPCTTTGFFGGTLSVTGSVRVQDSSQSTSGAYTVTLNNLSWQFTDTAGALTYTAVRNGTRSRAGTDSAITLLVTDTVTRTRPQITAVATISKELTWNFVADTPGDIVTNQPLPNGTVTVSGTWNWRRSTEDWNLTVATPVPLVYDPTCTTTAQRFTAGQVTLTGTIAGTSGTLQIDWSQCGKLPTRTFVPS
jgi:hypothetical protein